MPRQRKRRLAISKFKRPFATYYYANVDDDDDAYLQVGTSKTEEGAVKGAVFRVFTQLYGKAVIYSRDTGAVIYTVAPEKGKLSISWGHRLGLRRFKAAA